MATLALTIVGSAVGGPLGGAIGAALGQQVDRAILGGGKLREGPRLKELGVQTSSYGAVVPSVFGSMRVAGTVIWASDLIERRNKNGGGKGKPSTISYSYSANLAVALSSKPLMRIGRIWADGNLLRGESGDFKVQTDFRFYSGYGDQPVDPLIAADVGLNQCPAHRGLSYVVFEDLQLADFGNRIPSLTFEIFEREGPVTLTEIAHFASKGLIAGQSGEFVRGYALEGRDAREALGPLIAALPVIIRPKTEQLELIDLWALDEPYKITAIAQSNTAKLDRPRQILGSAASVPGVISIRYYEPERDYQSGMQSTGANGSTRNALQIDLPISASAQAGKRLAELKLLQLQKEQYGWSGVIATDQHILSVGGILEDAENQSFWRITELEHIRGATRVSAVAAITAEPLWSFAAEAGHSISAPDNAVGETRLLFLDMPALTANDPGKPIIAIAAAGTEIGWRRAALSLRQGNNLLEIGGTARSAIIGNAGNILKPHSPHILDNQNEVIVELINDNMELPAVFSDPLNFLTPIVYLGGEYLRYGSAEYIGNRQYKLKNLIRGCFGTEIAILGHLVAEDMLLIDQETIKILDEISVFPEQSLTIEVQGINDPVPASASLVVKGNAIRPLSPVHGAVQHWADGGVSISWIRRARIDYGWNDGVDQPIVEEREVYKVVISNAGIVVDEIETVTPNILITAAQLTELELSSGDTFNCAVSQIGRTANSVSLNIPVTL